MDSRGGEVAGPDDRAKEEDAESEEREEREERGRSGNCLAGYYSAFRCEVKTDIDHVIRDHAQTHPALHALSALVAGPVQAMASLQNADASFASGAPRLTFFEPALLLFLFPLRAFGGTAGD